MAVFNGTLVVLLAMGLMIAGIVGLFEPQRSLLAVEEGFRILRGFAPFGWPLWAAGVAALGFIVLMVELWPRRRRLIAQVENGVAEYEPSTVATMLERDLLTVEGVQRAHVQVLGNERRVDVRAALAADPELDTHNVVARAGNRIHEKLEKGLGLPVGRVRLAVEPGTIARERRGLWPLRRAA